MGETARILVVDDDMASRGLMEQILAEDGHQVAVATDGAEALELLQDEHRRGTDGFDAVVSDIRMVEADGLEVLDWVVNNAVETPVLLVTAFGNVDGAVDAIRRGAYDYISKPYDVNAIKLVVDRALRHRRLSAENRRLKREIREKYALQNVVGRSEAMLQVYKTAARVAATDATVLVVGESGTGKELVARAIHGASRRAQGHFIAVDCGAIAEGVLESELFGHARGSFTGATGARRDRSEDIPLLAEHFAARHAGVRGANITNEAREAMLAYPWPGNVRELENAVARALALNPGGTILTEDLPEAVRDHWRKSRGLPEHVPNPPQVAVLPPPAAPDPLLADRPTLDELNRRYAERVLRDLGGNKTRAAEALGIDRKTLSRLVGPEE